MTPLDEFFHDRKRKLQADCTKGWRDNYSDEVVYQIQSTVTRESRNLSRAIETLLSLRF